MIRVMKSSNISSSEKICLLCLYFTAACSYNDSLNMISLYCLVPIATVLCFCKYGFNTISSYLKPIMAMFLWVSISSLWASYVEAATRQLHQLLGVVMLTYVYFSLAKNKSLIPLLYFSFIICNISAWEYAQTNIISVIDVGVDRLNDEKLNANTLAYYTFYYTFATFICHQICEGKWKRIFLILFYLSIPLTLYTAFLTASRQVLVIQIPLIGLCLMQKYFRFNGKSVLAVLLIAVLVFMVFTYVSDTLYEGSLLQQRSQTDVKDDVRYVLLKDAFNVGMSNFFTGVGAGNFRFYTAENNFSHCTYLELFANTGIVGALLFIIPLLSFIKKQWIRYKLSKDACIMSFLIFGLVFSVDNFFYVFYPDMFLMAFMCLVMSHSNIYWNDFYK